MSESAPAISKRAVLRDLLGSFRPGKPQYLPDEYPDLTGRLAIITGANAGIGFQVMSLLYEKNCDVIAVVRTKSKGDEARGSVLNRYKNSKGSITVVDGCDFLDLTTVKAAANTIVEIIGPRPLNIIIHNAGIMNMNNKAISKQGHDAMFSTNVLGPQLLQNLLDPVFLRNESDIKRLVWVTSAGHLLAPANYGINWDNPTYQNVPSEKKPYAQTLYGQSKCANIYQAGAWAKINQDAIATLGAVSVSCYPGNLNTNAQAHWHPIARKLASYILYDSVYGAYTELYAALSPELNQADHQGAYIGPFGVVQEPRSDVKLGLTNGTDIKLWQLVQGYINEYR